MLLELLVDVITGFFAAMFALIPPVPIGANVTDGLDTAAAVITNNMASLGYWLPFGAVGTMLTLVIASMIASFVIFLVRFIVSLLSGGGGVT